MLGKIKLFLRCIDYSLSILIVVCCLAFGSWWFSAESYSYEEGLYPREEYCTDICQIYSDIGKLCLKRNDWAAAINAYNAALDAVSKSSASLVELDPQHSLAQSIRTIYDRLEFCYKQLGNTHKAHEIYNAAVAFNKNFIKDQVST